MWLAQSGGQCGHRFKSIMYTIFLVQWAYKHCQNILKYNYKWPSVSTWLWDANLKKYKTDVQFQKHSWVVAEQRNVRWTINTGFCVTYLQHQCPNCTPLLAPHPGRRGQLGTRPPPTVIILNYTLDRPARPLIVMSSWQPTSYYVYLTSIT